MIKSSCYTYKLAQRPMASNCKCARKICAMYMRGQVEIPTVNVMRESGNGIDWLVRSDQTFLLDYSEIISRKSKLSWNVLTLYGMEM